MKKFVATIAFLAMGFHAAPVMAHVGGPYSNNTHDGFQGGVFQGMMTMKNGSGMFRFSAGLEPIISPFAQSVVFHQGFIYYGDCFGMLDFVSKKISGMTNGMTAPPGATTTNGTPNFISNGQANYVCNTVWNGKITSTAPSVRFKAKGFAYIIDATYEHQITTTIDTTPPPIELPDGTAIVTTKTETITESGPIPTQRIKIRVSGGRLSPIAYTTFGAAAPKP